MKKYFFAIFSILACAAAAQERERIVVEETSFADVETMPSVTVIGADKIRSRGAVTLGDLLREVAGLSVIRSGSSGQSTSVFIRGAESRHTLVLIDGLEANDPSQVARGFDFANLGSENVERIEVFRGPQSVRFGSDAMGGVVNVVTKRGRGDLSGQYGAEAGSYNTRKYSAGVHGSKEQIHYSLAGARTEASGPSAADADQGNTEADASRRLSFSSRLGWTSQDRWGADLTVRTFETQNDLDYDGGPTGDDRDYRTSARQLLTGAELHGTFLQERLVSSVGAHYGTVERHYDNYADNVRTDEYHETFNSRITKFATRHQLTLSEISSLELGASLRGETSRSDSIYNGSRSNQPHHRNSVLGESLIYDLHKQGFLVEAGARHDRGDQFGSITSYSLKPGYRFQAVDVTLRAGLSSGFKAPTLYQLHSAFGDPGLSAEKSTAWEFSLEHELSPLTRYSVTEFSNRYTNLIDYDTVLNRYKNIAEARTQGVEVQAQHQFLPGWTTTASYTHLNTEDRATGRKLYRRPQNSASLEVRWARDPWEVAAVYTAVSRRDDRAPITGARTSLHSYDLVDLRAAYAVSDHVRLRARIENLFDRRYQETAGYGNSRLAGYFGVSGDF